MVKEKCICNGESVDKMHEVLFDKVTLDMQCACRLFEFRGIICRHCFLILAQKEVKNLSPKYVSKRWSKHIRRRQTYIKVSYKDNNDEPHVERYDLMCKRFYEIAEIACNLRMGQSLC